jgi:hypothetical protein
MWRGVKMAMGALALLAACLEAGNGVYLTIWNDYGESKKNKSKNKHKGKCGETTT